MDFHQKAMIFMKTDRNPCDLKVQISLNQTDEFSFFVTNPIDFTNTGASDEVPRARRGEPFMERSGIGCSSTVQVLDTSDSIERR